MSFKNLLEPFGDTSIERVEAAIEALKKGRGVLVVDNENRENEGDLIYAAETVTDEQMAFMIRECSGIVCVCISKEQAKKMQLPMMVEHNTSVYGTAFTISIDAAHGVTTGVSAPDRVKAIKAVINPNGKPSDLASPGHMFPLVAKDGGVLERDGTYQITGIRPCKDCDLLDIVIGDMTIRSDELLANGRYINAEICGWNEESKMG